MSQYDENARALETAQVKRTIRYRAVRRDALVPASPNRIAPASGYSGSPRGESPQRDYKKIIGAVFLGALLILIFFSKTIYGYHLPVVTATKPENGRLSKLEISSGVAAWAEVEKVYAAVSGKVEEVLVKEGDAVTEGQELYRLSFDRDEAERRLREIQNSRSKLQNDIQSINLKLEKQNRYKAELKEETYEEEDVSGRELDLLDADIEIAKLDVDKASASLRKSREAYRNARDMYGDDETGDSEVATARTAYQQDQINLEQAELRLEKLTINREELEKKLEDQENKAVETIEEKEKNRESKLKDYESDIAALGLDLNAKNIELNSLALQEEPYKKALAEFDAYAVVTAPISGTVISMEAGKGETIRAEQLLASIGAVGAFVVECPVSLDNNFVIPGDVVELSNSSRVVDGTVTMVTPTMQSKTVTVALESAEITSGETFDITFKKDSDTTYTLVPNGALHQDNDGYFLNQVKRRSGIMGQEYYLERLDVYIGDSDSKNTAIVQGITFFEPIVLISDKPVTAGDVISLSNEGDFFES